MISKLLKFWLIVSLSLICFFSKAQISHGGSPLFKDAKFKNTIPVTYLPRFEKVKMLKDEVFVSEKSFLKHAQYAYQYQSIYNSNNSGKWEKLEDGRMVWRIFISSPGAFSLGLEFSKFKLPKNAMLFVYNYQTAQVLGAYTEKNNKASGKFSIEPLEGDEIIVEYIEPLGAEFEAEIEIGAVLHDYKNIFNQLKGEKSSVKTSGSCNVNINCPEGDDWQIEKQSVCHILYNGFIASGALINNTSFDGKPYLLTAHHVIDSQGDAEDAIFYFNYEAADCESTTGSKSQSISGADLLATTSHLDFTLLELSVMPPASFSPYYAGWDRSGRIPLNTTCIHHPNADVKKISMDFDAPITDSYSDTKYTFDINTHWRIVDWEIGTTEGGSSGSPLFDENHRIVGDLTGGEADCEESVNDYYAKFSESWANFSEANQQLKVWLDPLNLGLNVLDGMDPYKGLRANFISSNDSICYSSQLSLENISQGEPDEYLWDFGEGAIPQSSTEEGPHEISYTSSGVKEIKLIVKKNGILDSVSRDILAMDFPSANFDFTVDLQKIQFINSSEQGETYSWDLGDGTSSSEENPEHEYKNSGNYTITLETENRCGTNSFAKMVQMNYNDLIKVYPNPSDGLFAVDLSQIIYIRTNWTVYDSKGAQVRSGIVFNYNSLINFDLKGMSSGVYILKLEIDGEILQRNLLLRN